MLFCFKQKFMLFEQVHPNKALIKWKHFFILLECDKRFSSGYRNCPRLTEHHFFKLKSYAKMSVFSCTSALKFQNI